MILSASRRTDIPTFYSEWFINRIKEGFFYVRNPMNIRQVSRIDISPELVDCIVFWTKNPIPMIPKLDELKDYKYYFQYSLTSYGKDIEKNLPDKKTKLIPAFRELSEKLGKKRVIWRYDPILFNETYTPEYHLSAFKQIAEALKGSTEKCVISFVDIYRKNKKNLAELQVEDDDTEGLREFAKKLYDIATVNDMKLATCAEEIELADIGIEHNSCIDKNVIEEITGYKLNVKKDPVQREECRCVVSVEMGSYNTCGNGCRYCYANFNSESVKENMKRYDPCSPILCDALDPENDKITVRKVKSIRVKPEEEDGQLSFFGRDRLPNLNNS